jgi:hypothetical protein
VTEPLHIAADRPLVIVDVDEVLALFFQGFGRFVEQHGFELRADRFALFGNLFRPGGTEAIELATGRWLFDEFFRSGADLIDPAPFAPESLAELSESAQLVILSNAPAHGRDERVRWLARHGMAYPLIINEGPKGPAIARMAAQTARPTAFVDDIVSHLDSCLEADPRVKRFQTIADPRLRSMAPSKPDHRRIDGWDQLLPAIKAAIAV